MQDIREFARRLRLLKAETERCVAAQARAQQEGGEPVTAGGVDFSMDRAGVRAAEVATVQFHKARGPEAYDNGLTPRRGTLGAKFLESGTLKVRAVRCADAVQVVV